MSCNPVLIDSRWKMTQRNSGAKCYKLQFVLSQYRFSGNQRHSLIPNRVTIRTILQSHNVKISLALPRNQL